MITQELLNYIRLQKQQGVSDETIRSGLLNSNWSEQDINQVLTQQVNSAFTAEEEKPKMIKTISTLFSLIAILYIASTMTMAGIVAIMDRAAGGAGVVFSFLKYFPTFGFIPILFSLVTLVFFFAALKIRNGSKFSFWLGVTTLLVVPLPAAFLSQTLMSPFVNWATNFKENIPPFLLNVNLLFRAPEFILVFIALVLLVISFRKFHFINEPLSKKAKIFLTFLFFIFVLPAFLVVSLGYIRASDTDYGFTKAKSEVSYRVYKSTLAPEGLVTATKFITNKELGGRQDAIQVVYDVPFTELLKEEKSKMIVLKQVGVEPGFDLQSYVSSTIKDSSSLQPVSLPMAKNQSAFLIERKIGDASVISFLIYITQDDVLIDIAGPYATKERLVQFAESLQ